jgi:ribosomal protein S18 acetylase RimI-like enzyme
MSLLQCILFPFVHEFWIGRTFVHRVGEGPAPPQEPLRAGLEISVLTPQDIERLRRSPDHDLLRRSLPCGPEVRRFGAWVDGALVCVCTFDFGEHYRRSRGFYHLGRNEAELADVFTSSAYRGRGIAGTLIRVSTERMHEDGFETVFAKVWHSNIASSRAFHAAGWKYFCFFIRLYPRGTKCVWHTEWRCL